MFFLFKKDHLLSLFLIIVLSVLIEFYIIDSISCIQQIISSKILAHCIGLIFLYLFASFTNGFFENTKMFSKKNYIPHLLILSFFSLLQVFLPICLLDLMAIFLILIICFILSVINLELNQMGVFFNIGVLLAVSIILNGYFFIYGLGVFFFILVETKYGVRYYINVILGSIMTLILYYGILFLFDQPFLLNTSPIAVRELTLENTLIGFLPLFCLALIGLFHAIKNRHKESGITKIAQNLLLTFSILSLIIGYYQPNASLYFLSIFISYLAGKCLASRKKDYWAEMLLTGTILSIFFLVFKTLNSFLLT